MKKVLLHACCAPCSIECVNVFEAEDFAVTLFWFNPNIHPFTEYRNRHDTLIGFAASRNILLVDVNDYGLRDFVRAVAGDIDARCLHCYTVRLHAAAKAAAENGFDSFSTTLLISPYQNHELLREVGIEAGKRYGVEFAYRDFRPQFKVGQAQARAGALYMQKYCGCVFSEEERYLK